MSKTKKMTVARALIEFLAHQWTVDGEQRERTIPGVFGIFGHGNVAGIGQALLELSEADPTAMLYRQARNEQAMVHQSVGYARMHRRRGTWASTASVGPGATNLLTGAALATTNRLPALLLPSDTFATRRADPVLQQLEQPGDTGLTVNDAFRPLSKFFDRVQRPEQLYSIALGAMRVLTDPAETGAVTIALPEDVQAEALDVPLEFLADREWRIRRPHPERVDLSAAIDAIRSSKRPLIIAGGGVVYSNAERALRCLAEATGIPVATTQAGGGALVWDHAQYLGGIGATGTTAANQIARDADLVLGVGTRYSDFTTGSRSIFTFPNVAFINVNVAALDAFKLGSRIPIVADARETLTELASGLADYRVTSGYCELVDTLRSEWHRTVDLAFTPSGLSIPGQPELIGAVQSATDPQDVVVQAAGSLPGDLHKLWRVRDSLGYHVEYAYSCMGYEIAGGLGVKRGIIASGSDRDVIVLVGDGSYLMLSSELATLVAENIKIIVVIVENHGYASIGHLSETVGSERYGTTYRKLDSSGRPMPDQNLPIDLAANARSYGLDVVAITQQPDAIDRVREAVRAAKKSTSSTVIHIVTDPLIYAPSGGGWWDVPVAEVSNLASTTQARAVYERERVAQRPFVGLEGQA